MRRKPLSPFIPLGAVAKMLGVHPETVVALIQREVLPIPDKLNGVWLFERKVINSYISGGDHGLH